MWSEQLAHVSLKENTLKVSEAYLVYSGLEILLLRNMLDRLNKLFKYFLTSRAPLRVRVSQADGWLL